MKLFITIIAAMVFISCNDNSSNSSRQEDSMSTDPGYGPMTDTTGTDRMNDTTAYGNADSARR